MNHLDTAFFARDTLTVAEDLIGCYLCREVDGALLRLKITETEAYVGPHDLACHSSKGRTKRTETMFAEPGTIYIYMIYGIHFMLNIVTEAHNFPAAVLIRGAGEYVGPGRLAKALGIDKSLNGKMASPENGLWFEPRDASGATEKGKIEKLNIKKTKRIGVEYAGPEWAEKEYRFVLID